MVMGFGFYPPRYNTREAPPPQRPVWGPPDVSQQLQEGIGNLGSTFDKSRQAGMQLQLGKAELRQQAALDESRRLSSEAIGSAANGQSPGAVLLGMGQQYQQQQSPYQQPGPSFGNYNAGGHLPTFAQQPHMGLDQNLKTMIAGKEEQYGLPGGFLQKTAWIESSGDPNAKNPNSSAAGLFQQTTGNWKQYGDPNGSRFDPVASTDAAARFAVYNQNVLRNALGRDPTPGELYLAHQQGPTGALRLLTNPEARAADLVGAKAVRLNGGDMSTTAGQFASRWTSRLDNDPQAVAPAAPGPVEAAAAPRPSYQLASNNPSFVPADPTLAPRQEDEQTAATVVNAQTAQTQQQAAQPPGFMGLPLMAQGAPGAAPVSSPVMQMPEQPYQVAGSPVAAQGPQTVPNPFQAPRPAPAPQAAPLPPQAPLRAAPPQPQPMPQQGGVGYNPPAPGAMQAQPTVDPRLVRGLQAAVRAGDSHAISAIQTLMQLSARNRPNLQFETLPNGQTGIFNPQTGEFRPLGNAAPGEKPGYHVVEGRLIQTSPQGVRDVTPEGMPAGARPLTPDEARSYGLTGGGYVDRQGVPHSLGPQTAISIDQRAETAEAQQFGKDRASRINKELETYKTQREKALAQRPQLALMEDIFTRNPNADPLTTLKADYGPILQSMGINVPGLSDAQTMQSLLQKMAPPEHVVGSGAQSDLEYKGLLKSFPTLMQDPQARTDMLSLMRAGNTRNEQLGNLAEAFDTGDIKSYKEFVEAKKGVGTQEDLWAAYRKKYARLFAKGENDAKRGGWDDLSKVNQSFEQNSSGNVFNSPEEAEKANLPKGTHIQIKQRQGNSFILRPAIVE